MEVRYHPAAERELEYESSFIEERWGEQTKRKFQADYFSQFQGIVDDPLAKKKRRPVPYRRAVLRRYPYYIAYTIVDETIWILAIAPSRRKPLYWKDRLSELG